MTNQLINFDDPALEMARIRAAILVNNISFGKRANKQFIADFTGEKGTTITYRKPVRHKVVDGPDMTGQWQDTIQDSDTMVISFQKTIPVEFTAKELTLSDVEYARGVENDMIAMANQIDRDGLELYKDIYFKSGTAGTAPASLESLIEVGVKREQYAIPNNSWLFVDPVARGALTASFAGVFDQTIVDDIVTRAKLGRKADFDIFSTQNIFRHIAGTGTGYIIDNSSASGVATFSVGTGAGTFLEGDILEVDNVNAVNPITKADLGHKMTFTVTADYSGGGGNVSVLPAPVNGGAYQNVTALPVNAAAITKTASHMANIMATDKAFALVTVPYAHMEGFSYQKRVVYDGIAITVTSDGDINTLRQKTRMDVMYGWKATYPDLAIRYLGQ